MATSYYPAPFSMGFRLWSWTTNTKTLPTFHNVMTHLEAQHAQWTIVKVLRAAFVAQITTGAQSGKTVESCLS